MADTLPPDLRESAQAAHIALTCISTHPTLDMSDYLRGRVDAAAAGLEAALAAVPAPTAQPAAEADDAEKASFYAMFGAAEKATGHKPSHYDVWLMARGLMTADGRSAQPVQQPGAEPVGRLHADGYFTWKRRDGYVLDAKLPCDFYLAAPAQRQPLSDEEIEAIWKAHVLPGFGERQRFYSPVVYARAIESAHGIAAQKGEKL